MGRFLRRRATLFVVGAGLIATSAVTAFADSPSPDTITASVTPNQNGTVTVSVSGGLGSNWGRTCVDNGYAIVWGDSDAGGNLVPGPKGVGSVLVGTSTATFNQPADNTVHQADCTTGSARFSNEQHIYASANKLPPKVCVVAYDIRPPNSPATGSHSLVAGGPTRNTDNSVEKNGLLAGQVCTDALVVPALDLAAGLTATPQVTVGDPISWTVSTSNTNASSHAAGQPLSVITKIPAALIDTSTIVVTQNDGWTCGAPAASGTDMVFTCTRSTPALGIGASSTLATVTATSAHTGSMTSVTTVSTSDETGSLANNSASASTTVVAGANKTLDLAAGLSATGQVTVGDPINWTVSTTNTSTSTQATDQQVSVVTKIPTALIDTATVAVSTLNGWSCTAPVVSGTDVVFTCTRTSPTLAIGASSTIATVTATSAHAGQMTSVSSVSTPDETGPFTNNNAQATTTVAPPAGKPDVTISKTATSQVNTNADITYTLVVTNDSSKPTDQAFTVTDNLPSNVTFKSLGASSAVWNCGASAGQNVSCTWVGAPLTAGNSTPPITVVATAPSTAVDRITNTTTVFNPDDGDPGNNTASANTKVVAPAAVLSLVKSASPASGSSVSRGQEITYRLRYTNTGSGVATAADLSDQIPVGTTYVSGSAACGTGCTPSYDSGTQTVHWKLDIQPSSAGDVTFSVTVDNDDANGSILTNQARIVTGTTTVTSNTVQHQVFVPTGSLQLTKSASPTSATAGDLITFTLVATASGNVTQRNVVVTDDIPTGTTFSAASCASPCSSAFAGNTVTFTLGDMTPGSSQSMTFEVRVNAPGADGTIPAQVTNTGFIASTTISKTPSNTVVVPLTQVLGVKIVKTPTALPYTGTSALVELLLGLAFIGGGMVLFTWPGRRPRTNGLGA